jgi:hypothetical protein
MGYTLIAALKSEGVHGEETIWRVAAVQGEVAL